MGTRQRPAEWLVARSSAVAATNPEPGLLRCIGSYNDKLMLVEHQMQKGWVGSRHSHPHEQIVYVVRGRLRVVVGDNAFEAATGDSFVVAGGIEHEAAAVEDSVVIDVFTPCRHDYV